MEQIPTASCFNTQPPEGGWIHLYRSFRRRSVSTHSRPKAAGTCAYFVYESVKVSTHSRPKAAGVVTWMDWARLDCFNTQPPEGGWD